MDARAPNTDEASNVPGSPASIVALAVCTELVIGMFDEISQRLCIPICCSFILTVGHCSTQGRGEVQLWTAPRQRWGAIGNPRVHQASNNAWE